MLPPCAAVKHPRPDVPDAAYDCERVGALVQRHLKDGAAAVASSSPTTNSSGIRRWPARSVTHRSGQWWPRSL